MLDKLKAWYKARQFRVALAEYMWNKEQYYEWRDRTLITHPHRKANLEAHRANMHLYWKKIVNHLPRRNDDDKLYFSFDGKPYVLSYNRKTAVEKRIYLDKYITAKVEGGQWIAQEGNVL